MTLGLLIVFFLSSAVALGLRASSRIRTGDGLTAAVMFLPALIYWLDGKPLSEFSAGPSGVALKMQEAAARPVSAIELDLEPRAIQHAPEAAMGNAQAVFWEICADYITVGLGDVPEEQERKNRYLVNLARAIRASVVCGRLIGVVVVDEREKYIGSYDASFFIEMAAFWSLDMPETDDEREAFVRLLKTRTIFGLSLEFPEKRLRPGEGYEAQINRDKSLADALKVFRETGASFLALTDDKGVLRGILPRRRVVDLILAAILDPEAESDKGNS